MLASELDDSPDPGCARALQRHIPPGATVLEVGVGGASALLDLYRSSGCRCFGVDILPSAVATAGRNALAVGARVHVAVASGFLLPFPNGTFDRVLSCGVIEHFPPERSRGLLREHTRVCRAGGRVLVSVPNALDLLHTLHRRSLGRRYPYWPERSYTPRALARELKAAGLTPVARDGYAPLWSLRQSRLLYPLGAALFKLGLLGFLERISNPSLLTWCANMILLVGEKSSGQ
jgi:SAM-dependent methyltransferase